MQRGKFRSRLPIGNMLFMDFPPYFADPSEKHYNISLSISTVIHYCGFDRICCRYIIMFPMQMRAFDDNESFLNAKLTDKKC